MTKSSVTLWTFSDESSHIFVTTSQKWTNFLRRLSPPLQARPNCCQGNTPIQSFMIVTYTFKVWKVSEIHDVYTGEASEAALQTLWWSIQFTTEWINQTVQGGVCCYYENIWVSFFYSLFVIIRRLSVHLMVLRLFYFQDHVERSRELEALLIIIFDYIFFCFSM